MQSCRVWVLVEQGVRVCEKQEERERECFWTKDHICSLLLCLFAGNRQSTVHRHNSYGVCVFACVLLCCVHRVSWSRWKGTSAFANFVQNSPLIVCQQHFEPTRRWLLQKRTHELTQPTAYIHTHAHTNTRTHTTLSLSLTHTHTELTHTHTHTHATLSHTRNSHTHAMGTHKKNHRYNHIQKPLKDNT